jgi:hypothetical protein
MKGTICALVCLLSVTTAVAQGRTRAPFRIQIRHADPWMVKAMLEGMPIRTPEISSLPGFAGVVANGANTGAGKLLQDGFLVVNPTDNSLWYYPNN